MFLHLGGEFIVPKDEVIAIIDLKTSNKSQITGEFLEIAAGEGFISEIVPRKQAKSIIITDNNIIFSPISTGTLKKRSDNFKVFIEEGPELE